MRKPEQKLYDTFKARAAGRMFWSTFRTENVNNPGFPDLMIIRNWPKEKIGLSALVELKAIGLPKRSTSKFFRKNDWSVDQVNFQIECAQSNYPSFFLIRDVELQGLYLIRNQNFLYSSLNLAELTFQQANNWFMVDDWDAVFDLIEEDMRSMGGLD